MLNLSRIRRTEYFSRLGPYGLSASMCAQVQVCQPPVTRRSASAGTNGFAPGRQGDSVLLCFFFKGLAAIFHNQLRTSFLLRYRTKSPLSRLGAEFPARAPQCPASITLNRSRQPP